MDKRDEIIAKQNELRSRLQTVGDDLWGGGSAPSLDELTRRFTDAPKAPLDDESLNELIRAVNQNADELIRMSNELNSSPSRGKDTPAPQKAAPQTQKAAGKEAPKEEKAESIEDLKKELQSYIGLDTIKKEVDSLINYVTIMKKREVAGLPTPDLSLHMVFSGNPGTGKTMIARLMARIYKSLGILSKGQLVETDRSGLVAGYVGQTAIKTKEVIDKAKGGVLFIDEAYTLTSRGGNDYGQEAVDTLLKAMEDMRDDFIVIVAGYTELMEEFVHSNPGLQSRFNRFMNFPDYTVDEMSQIFDMRCSQSGYRLQDEHAREVLLRLITDGSKDPNGFGNARGVRNLFERALSRQADRLAQMDSLTQDDLMTLTREDLENT